MGLWATRSKFILPGNIMKHIPNDIRGSITHHDHAVQISGFKDLFIYLNMDVGSQTLRQLVNAYFDKSPPLRAHLSQSSASLLV